MSNALSTAKSQTGAPAGVYAPALTFANEQCSTVNRHMNAGIPGARAVAHVAQTEQGIATEAWNNHRSSTIHQNFLCISAGHDCVAINRRALSALSIILEIPVVEIPARPLMRVRIACLALVSAHTQPGQPGRYGLHGLMAS